LELVGDVGGVEWVAGFVGEDEFGVTEPCGEALTVLPGPVGPEDLGGVGVEVDGAVAGVGFGFAVSGVPAELGDLPADADGAFFRSRSGGRMPQVSPRRSPRRAMSWYSG
jgi:hypothetical protein